MQSSDPSQTKSFVPPAFSKPVGLDRKRIAVLPFANISPDPADSYFADGLTEELITTLSKVRGLRVIARTSSSHYSGTSKSVSQIANELQVGSVLEGSVRKSGNKVRVTAQLIEATGQEHLWAEQYDRDLSDIFLIQTDIARHVANGLQVSLLSKDKNQVEREGTENVQAHVAYLKGRVLLRERSERALRGAEEQFERAIRHDPRYAAAYAGLADVHNLLSDWGFAPMGESREKSKALVKKALELDPELPEAHLSLAASRSDDYQWALAEEEYKHAIALIPSNATAHHWYSLLLGDLGRQNEALSEILRAEELDPLSLIISTQVFYQYTSLGNEDEAAKRWQKIKDIDPESPDFFNLMFYDCLLKSEYDTALDVLNKLKERWPDLRGTMGVEELDYACIYAFRGQREAAVDIIRRTESKFNEGASGKAPYSYLYALAHLALGDLDECFKWLEKAIDAHERPFWFSRLRFDPLLEKVRKDPRFNDLLKRANLPLAPIDRSLLLKKF